MTSHITWKDTSFAREPGRVRFRHLTVSIRPEHIALWQDDPDGRFKLMPAGLGASSAELGRFFPSL